MGKATVLVLDSENNVLKIIEAALGTISYDLLLSRNSREGLAQLAAHPVDIVLADQTLEGMGCLEFLKMVGERYPDVVTIMLADRVDLDTTIRAINDAGIYRFIQKPWNAFELRINIARGLELRRMVLEKRKLLERIRKNESLLNQLQEEYPHIRDLVRQKTVPAVSPA